MKFSSPRYWPIWIGYGLLRCISRLPYDAQKRIGMFLGFIMYHLLKKRRRIAKINLRLCFPELDEQQRAKLLRRHFDSLGMMIIEIGIGWWTPYEMIEPMLHVDGLKNLEAALQSGKGIILITTHFTTLELAEKGLGPDISFNVMNRRHKNALLGELIHKERSLHANIINKDDARAMLKLLKKGEIIWYAPDQNYRGKGSIDVPFFGIPTPTNSATSRIAKMANALVIPFFVNREENGSGYKVMILPALDNFPTDDPAADTLRINQIFEAQIRKYPDQYLWIHRRFKGHDRNHSIYD